MSVRPVLASAPPAAALATSCAVCAAPAFTRFSTPLDGASLAYCECTVCSHLTLAGLLPLPCYHHSDYFQALDIGWSERTARILSFIRLLALLPGVGITPRTPVLDYGCGNAALVAGLLRYGFPAAGYDPAPPPEFAPVPLFTDWAALRSRLSSAGLVTCIEVLEHLPRPAEALKRIASLLAPRGYLLLSTALYSPRLHDASWFYLNPSAGHVSIFTEASLRSLLARFGFRPVLRLNSAVWLFVRSSQPPGPLASLCLRLSEGRVHRAVRIPFISRLAPAAPPDSELSPANHPGG